LIDSKPLIVRFIGNSQWIQQINRGMLVRSIVSQGIVSNVSSWLVVVMGKPHARRIVMLTSGCENIRFRFRESKL